MGRYLILTSLICLSSIISYGQIKLGQREIPIGETVYYNAEIILPQAELDGICIVKAYSDGVAACIINEFGIKALDFTYDIKRHRTKLHSVVKFMDKWYIRCTLRKDLSRLMQENDFSSRVYDRISKGDGSVSLENKRHKIKYQLSPVNYEIDR